MKVQHNINDMGKLGSGYHINRAADDAAGLEISEKMRAQIGDKHMSVGEHIMLHACSPVHCCKAYYDKMSLLEQWYAGWTLLATQPNHPLAQGAAAQVPGVFKFLFGTDVKYDGTNWDVLNEQLNGATEEKLAGLASDIGFISVVAGGNHTCDVQEMTAEQVLQLLQ